MTESTTGTPPLKLEDFQPMGKLTAAYELRPDRIYLIIFDGKHFDIKFANSHLAHLHELHPNINVHVIASIHPKEIEVREKKEENK